MLKKHSGWMVLLLGGFLTHSISHAQLTPIAEKRKPIVCKWETLHNMQYFYSGLKVSDLKSLEHIISPLNDPEANRLLNVCKGSRESGIILLSGGSALLAGGLVTTLVDNNDIHNGADTQQVVGLVVAGVGLVVDYVGGFKILESRTSEFNAVQRYNAVVHGDEETSWAPTTPKLGTTLLTLKF